MVANEDRDEIEQLIRQHCQVPPPNEEFAESLAARATHELTCALQEQSKAGIRRAQCGLPTARRLRRAAIAVVAIAAVILAGVWLRTGGKSHAWGQVIDAVRTKPWVHGVSALTNETEKLEIWFSMSSAVAAVRSGSWALYDDGGVGIHQEYDPREKEIYRLSDLTDTKKEFRAIQTTFSDLFRGSEKLGPDLAGTRIAKQERRRVSDQGREWIEYTLSLESTAGPRRVVFLVDPQTRLPQSMEYFDANEPTSEAKPRMKLVLDYPEEGPTDIYALGVPRSAKIVDRMPKPDLARVIDGVRSSRRRFADSYYAIVTESMDAPAIGRTDKWWQSASLHQVWCKGDYMRVEQGRPHNMRDPRFYVPSKSPSEGIDKMAWWKEQLKDFYFEPSGVCDGKAIYAPKRAPPGPLMKQQNAVWEIWQNINPGEDRACAASFGPVAGFLPELYAYPVGIGQPNKDTVVELDSNPPGDLAGALLLKYRHRSTNPRVISSYRFWVDPARSYVALRYELGEAVDTKAGPDTEWPDTYVAEELRQAPSGIWYGAVVRRLLPGKVASPDKRGGTVYRFFVDFKADIPDSLFKPGPVAAVKATTPPPPGRAVNNNLRDIGVAMQRYNDLHGRFPAAYTVDKQGHPLLSWRVELLPLVGQEKLYKQFHVDEPWDSPYNRPLIEKMPDIFGSPDPRSKEKGRTRYVVPVGKETVFPGSTPLSVSDIRDGCANTIMAVELDDDHAVIWTRPQDLSFNAANPAEGLAALPKGGFWALLCDSSVRWIPKEFDPKYLRAAFMRAGGEAIEW